MKRRIAIELLRLHQSRAMKTPCPFLSQLNEFSYELVADVITDIKRPFSNICIHGRQPHLILPFLKEHNRKFNKGASQYNITVVDFVRN